MSSCTYNFNVPQNSWELNIEWPRWLACNITVTIRCYFHFHFHFQGQHNKLERDRVNQSEGRLSTRRFSVRLWEIEGLFTDRTVFHDRQRDSDSERPMGKKAIANAYLQYTVIHTSKSDIPPASCHGTCISPANQTRPCLPA